MDALTVWFTISLFLPYPSRPLPFKPVPVPIESGCWTVRGTPLGPSKADYLNETRSQGPGYYLGSSELWADDVHRTTADPIIAIDMGYYTELPSISATVYFYANPNDSQRPPPPVVSFMFTNLPGAGVNFVHLPLPQAVNLPQDTWLGVQWSDLTGQSGLLFYYPPSLGTSHEYVRRDGNGDHILEDLVYFQFPIPDLFIGTYVPCPDPPCGGDLNLDGRIDGTDIQLFTDCAVGVAPPYFPCFRADLDENGATDDAALLVQRLLTAP